MRRPGSERARERRFQGARGPGANRPGSESSRERIGQGSIGRFAPGANWPGSEKAVNRQQLHIYGRGNLKETRHCTHTYSMASYCSVCNIEVSDNSKALE